MDYSLNSPIIPTQEDRHIDLTAGTGLRPVSTNIEQHRKPIYAARRLEIEWKRAGGGGIIDRFPDADGDVDYHFDNIEAAIIHKWRPGLIEDAANSGFIRIVSCRTGGRGRNDPWT